MSATDRQRVEEGWLLKACLVAPFSIQLNIARNMKTKLSACDVFGCCIHTWVIAADRTEVTAATAMDKVESCRVDHGGGFVEN